MSAPSALPRIVVVGTGPASVRAAQAPVHATTDFQALQNAFERARVEDIQYFVFDLPSFRGHDLRQVPLAERRALLEKVLAISEASRIRYSEAFEGSPDDLLAAACRMGLEGLIGKRVDAPYVSARVPSWIKLKCAKRQEFVICAEWTKEGRVRHAVFHALRTDKEAGSVTLERPVEVEPPRPRPARFREGHQRGTRD